MSTLDVPGATLYYETIGKGPLLLLISGANGSTPIWQQLASHLKDHFTVATYDRRGFSHSYLTGSQDYEHRLETDADDAQRLIKHLSPNEPATVLGNSSGAIVSLELLTRHPSVIRQLIPHEPPACTLLPDCDHLLSQQREMYDIYRRHGVHPAIEMFAEMIKAGEEGRYFQAAFDARNGPFISSNVQYWMERELLQYPFHDVNLEALKKQKDHLILANGSLSNKTAMQYVPNTVIAEKLGMEVEHFSGAHIGYASHPADFARELLGFLKKKDGFYQNM